MVIRFSIQMSREAASLCSALCTSIHPSRVRVDHWATETEVCVRIECIDFNTDYRSMLVPVIVQWMSQTLEERLCIQIIREVFQYHNDDEINQIMHMVQLVMEGEKPGVPGCHSSVKQMIEKATDAWRVLDEHTSFCFDAFIQFRLRDYRKALQTIVEKAIDEKKLEEEYQEFIHTLRCYVEERRFSSTVARVVFDTHSQLYTEDFRPKQVEELLRAADVSVYPIDEKNDRSMTMAALLALNPQQLIVYGDEAEDALVATVVTIFQERAVLKSVHQFRTEADQWASKEA
ncbi:putative sporulation protein YtxC [Aureibacillus halotolerans]|uniref:Putative sporulation protein YtxC n=1 Tax=Aureibacillus halotolerans TaxID=1508390 RepID=A0A4R6TYW8_9BACI|nr:putative sporulation protein YtxC [Aureibacillus halotolerans]TDQ39158.1 putative sporulation protein YtxC [Aureibacillus halotolerans]